ncbi:MAG: hypothetical protein RRB13_10970 [bacterium]|nr:hypothetical protein [bacterium]
MSKKLLLSLLALTLFINDASAWIPDRRRLYEDRDENVYMVIPALASMPGVGVFVGVLGSFSNLWGSGVDAAVTEAQTVGNSDGTGSDIHIRAYALREVPLLIPGLTFEYWFGDIKFNDYYSYLPGRDSPNYLIPYTGEFNYYFLRPSYRLWERRFELSYNLVFFKGYEINSAGQEVLQASHAASGQIKLDFTDDWVDPHKGLRMTYSTNLRAPKKSILGTSNTEEDPRSEQVKTHQYNLGLYLPWGEQTTLALYREWCSAQGLEESDQVITCGFLRLRGYPGGRWSDRFAQTKIAELRYSIPTNLDMDWLLVHGKLEGLQLAGFYEEGQVSPQDDERLTQDIHRSYGAGVRALIDAIVLRLDLGFSEEGPQTHLTIDHAF